MASRSRGALALVALLGGVARAEDVVGSVSVARVAVGSQVTGWEDVVIYLEDAPAAAERMPTGPFSIVQRGKTFLPRVLVVPQGARVEFPNQDRILHNVFSPASGTSFDLGLYKRGLSRSVEFDRPGVVPVFCNIHPQMIAYVVVVTNPHFARPDPAGRFSLRGVPPGTYRAVAWFPYGKSETKTVTVTRGRAAELRFTLRERRSALDHPNKEGKPYTRY